MIIFIVNISYNKKNRPLPVAGCSVIKVCRSKIKAKSFAGTVLTS